MNDDALIPLVSALKAIYGPHKIPSYKTRMLWITEGVYGRKLPVVIIPGRKRNHYLISIRALREYLTEIQELAAGRSSKRTSGGSYDMSRIANMTA